MGTPNLDFATLDGLAPSYADISFKVQPRGLAPAGLALLAAAGPLLDVKDIKAVNTGVAIERGKQRGASGGRVMKRTTGQEDDTASITFYLSGWRKVLTQFVAIAPRRGNQVLIGLVFFDFSFYYSVPGDVGIYETRLKSCMFDGRDLNDTEGTDATVVEVPINVLQIAEVLPDGTEVVFL